MGETHGIPWRTTKAILFLLLTALAPLFCYAQDNADTSPPAPVPAQIKERLARLLPQLAEAGTLSAGERQFYSFDLYRYIDGAADGFLAFDMIAMVHQEYKAKDADITVDIYDMGKPLNAFGIYSAERSPNCHFLPLGAEGYVSDSLKPSLVNAVELSDEKMRAKLIAMAPCGRLGIAGDMAGPSCLPRFRRRRLLCRGFLRGRRRFDDYLIRSDAWAAGGWYCMGMCPISVVFPNRRR
jgi:hypothetical protein